MRPLERFVFVLALLASLASLAFMLTSPAYERLNGAARVYGVALLLGGALASGFVAVVVRRAFARAPGRLTAP